MESGHARLVDTDSHDRTNAAPLPRGMGRRDGGYFPDRPDHRRQPTGGEVTHNAFSTALFEVKVKPAKATDTAALLQTDMIHLSSVSTTGPSC
jgi:hypothetical protein